MTDKSNYEQVLGTLGELYMPNGPSNDELLKEAQVHALLAIADAISVMFRNKQYDEENC